MAGVRIAMTVRDAGVRELLRELGGRAADLGGAFEEIGAMLLTSTQQRFEAQRDPSGVPWKPLAQATQEQWVRQGRRLKSGKRGGGGLKRGGGSILRRKGLLYASLTYLAEARRVTVGTNKVYAAIHQLGGQAGRGGKVRIPARPYLGINAADEREIGSILRKHLLGGL